MPEQPAPEPKRTRRVTIDQRIAELQARPPVYINHGEALLIQGMATASFREQRLSGNRILLDD
nr:hypothetical protein [uncultured Ruegeria sp.]